MRITKLLYPIKNLFSVIIVLLLAARVCAEIAIIDSGAGWDNNKDDIMTDAQLGNLNLTGATKLVVSIGVKGAAAASLPLTATYKGSAMTLAVAQSDSDGVGWTGIYYLDDPPATAGDLVMSASTEYSLGVSALVLSGTDPGMGAVVSSQTLSTNLNTTAKGSVVLAAYSGAQQGATGVAGDLTQLMVTGPIGSGSYASGYVQVPVPGAIDASFTATDGSTRQATAVAEFKAQPAPAGTVFTIR